jgi:hypothetical protein
MCVSSTISTADMRDAMGRRYDRLLVCVAIIVEDNIHLADGTEEPL